MTIIFDNYLKIFMWTKAINKLPKDPLVYLATIGVFTVGNYLFKLLNDAYLSGWLYLNMSKLEKPASLLVERRNKNIKEFLEKYKNEISDERIKEIAYLSATELTSKIRNKEIKSREAVLAYCIRAATIGVELCLINDVFFEEALIEANAADKLLASKNAHEISSLPPLLGLPITLKDASHYKGKTATLGNKYLAGNISTYNSHPVDKIKRAGAIPICFTNVPQSLFAIESSNFLWGEAQNPWNRKRTPGGSSGGCAGAVASFCSPLSLTSDFGGSTRFPASFNGLYGLKPSYSRITNKDQIRPSGDVYSGWKTWSASTGPISRKFEDILLFARTFFGKYDEDFSLPQKVFDETEFRDGLSNYFNKTKKAKIAISKGFSISEPFEEQLVTLDKVKQHFISLGHEVVDFDFEDHIELYEKCLINLSVIMRFTKIGLRGEKAYYYFNSDSSMNIGAKCWIYKKFWGSFYRLIGKDRIARRYEVLEKSLNDTLTFLTNSKEIDVLKERFYKQMREAEIDTIIMPVAPFPAGERNKFEYQMDHLYYCMLTSVLNLSGGVVPVKIIEDIAYNTKHDDCIAKSIKESMKNAKGLPYGFQVLTLPYQDEKALRLMQEVDQVFKFSENSEVWNEQKNKVNSYVCK